MSKVCLSLAVLCLFALHGVIDAAKNEPACRNFNRKQVIDAAKSAIETCDGVLDLYNEIAEIFYMNGDKMASVIRDLKYGLTNGIDLYEKSPKAVIEWCSRVTPLISAHKDGASISKDNLIKELDDATPIANQVQDGLSKSKQHINTAGSKLFEFERHLRNTFNEKFPYIMDDQRAAMKNQFPELNKKVASIREFVEDFVCTQDKINIAYADTGKIKVLANVASTFVPLAQQPGVDDSLSNAANDLINDCAAYQKKYD